MNKYLFLGLFCLLSFAGLYAQETITTTVNAYGGQPISWTQWIGRFHLIILHLPIALIIMTVVAELLFSLLQRPIFDNASKFMIVSAAFLAPPTALLGLIYSTTMFFTGVLAVYFIWHMLFGISTALLAIYVAYIRVTDGRTTFYLSCLALLFLVVSTTAFFGGQLTFGPNHMSPPIHY